MFTNSYYVHSYLPPSFYAAFGMSFATLLFALLAFIAPYWIESYDIVHSDFVRIGIWMVCFNKFIHPRDSLLREYNGCIWLYDKSLGDMWFYINPWWLVGVQVILCVAVTIHVVCLLLYCAYFWFKIVQVENRICLTSSCALAQLVAGICWSVSIILFGIESQNRQWFPRPDQNLISWSFWTANITAACCFVCCAIGYMQTRELQMLKAEEKRARAQLQHDPFLQNNPGTWQPEFDSSGHEIGVLDIGALPVDYEKESHGVFAPAATYRNSQSQLDMAGQPGTGLYTNSRSQVDVAAQYPGAENYNGSQSQFNFAGPSGGSTYRVPY